MPGRFEKLRSDLPRGSLPRELESRAEPEQVPAVSRVVQNPLEGDSGEPDSGDDLYRDCPPGFSRSRVVGFILLIPTRGRSLRGSTVLAPWDRPAGRTAFLPPGSTSRHAGGRPKPRRETLSAISGRTPRKESPSDPCDYGADQLCSHAPLPWLPRSIVVEEVPVGPLASACAKLGRVN